MLIVTRYKVLQHLQMFAIEGEYGEELKNYVAKEKCNTLKSQKIQMTNDRFVRNRNAPICLWDYNVEANTICF